MTTVFHNTNKLQDVSGPGWPFLWLSERHARLDPIVNLFVTYYFLVAFGMGPKLLAHRPKYITANGRDMDSIDVTLSTKINKQKNR